MSKAPANSLIKKHRLRTAVLAFAAVAVGAVLLHYVTLAAQPQPESLNQNPDVPSITTDTQVTQGSQPDEVFELEPEFYETVWDSALYKIKEPPLNYITAGIIILLVSIGIVLAIKRQSPVKRKSRIAPRWSSRKSAFISMFMVAAGGFAVWQVLAAVPGQYASSWYKHVPIRVANYGSGVSSSAFHGAISRWNTLARKSILTASTSSPMIRVRAGDANARASYARRYGTAAVCDIWLAPGHKNSSTVLGHEIGHCLGYTDHVPAAQWRGSWVRVCDRSSHSYYSPYKGVMSYCSILANSSLFGINDLEALRAYKYTTNTVVPGGSSGGSGGSTASGCPTKGDSSGSHPTIRKGSTGTCVQHAEYILSRVAHYDVKKNEHPGKIDTVFDTATYNAVRAYQARKKLTVDGIIGYNTWRSLHGACAYINKYLKNNYRC